MEHRHQRKYMEQVGDLGQPVAPWASLAAATSAVSTGATGRAGSKVGPTGRAGLKVGATGRSFGSNSKAAATGATGKLVAETWNPLPSAMYSTCWSSPLASMYL